MIEREQYPCWIIGDDDEDHYGDEDQARDSAEGAGVAASVSPLPSPCWTLRCDCPGEEGCRCKKSDCWESYNVDENVLCHFDSSDTLRRFATAEGWLFTPAGAYCPECRGAETAGQLALPGLPAREGAGDAAG